jgi:hypothetical protein
MQTFRFDHLHLRSPDPDATARFFETMFGADITRSVYPPGTLYPGQMRVTMRVGGQKILIARRIRTIRWSHRLLFLITAWSISVSRSRIWTRRSPNCEKRARMWQSGP